MSRPPLVTPEERAAKVLRLALPGTVLRFVRYKCHGPACRECGRADLEEREEWRVYDGDACVLAVAATPGEAVNRAVFLWGKHKRKAAQ